MYHQLTGDIIQLAKTGSYDVLIHGCNCFHTMGAGVAARVKLHFPEAYRADLETERGSIHKLGTVSYGFHQFTDVTSDCLIIANAYTQFNYGRAHKAFDYDALRACFEQIKQDLEGMHILYPAIGAGLGKGDWSLIHPIIKEIFETEDHTFVQYKPTHQRAPQPPGREHS